MPEKEPLYIKELRKEMRARFDQVDQKFDQVDKKIGKEVGELASMTAQHFLRIEEKMATKDDIKEVRDEMAEMKVELRDEMKDNVKEILSHIGRYEVRAQNVEDILLKDHKPRIIELEKKAFA